MSTGKVFLDWECDNRSGLEPRRHWSCTGAPFLCMPHCIMDNPQGTLVENDMEWDMDLRHIWDPTTALAPSSRYDMDLPEWTALVPPS